MSEFIVTKAAQLKKNAENNFVAVSYTAPKRKKPIAEINKDTSYNQEQSQEEEDQEKEMKRLRWEVLKFGSSGLAGTDKKKSKVALAISLGAKPPKNRRMNYKNLKLKKSKEKEEAAKEKLEQEHQSGLTNSLKKTTKKKRVQKDKGILGVYGKVSKSSRDRTK
ncbi:uncharacterized protein C1orf131 homolog [Cotesia glomerata]|uniref:Uncharacterized protein n=1 Tax=Cotesia glomerata TaxID=32391 RepID=A0AAV7J3A9_COTGL|nr:uncharacterized protein C1orf131 homolog [Cotesia glomerata]KAH0564321.1 hypothetical protein KQX54_011428 [Cotesia glomerata]